MKIGDYDPPLAPGLVAAQSWQATVILGTVTLFLGLIVSFRPAGSLNVVAILLGLLMILSGIFHLVRIFGPGEGHRVWLGIAGLLFIVIGALEIIGGLMLRRAASHVEASVTGSDGSAMNLS
jgi:uncharacterized membrane protein HdeD (DUF308 family)